MKLLYTLTGPQREALGLEAGEEVLYCVPVDLEFDSRRMQAREAYAGTIFLVVTGTRFLVLQGDELSAQFPLAECEKIKELHVEVTNLKARLEQIKQEESQILGVQQKKAEGAAFCTGCGKKLEPGARFCDSCGTAVKG